MKLRFAVDQAEAFRNGIDCPKSIVSVEVNPAKLSPAERNLIADRMEGIDVCHLEHSGKKSRELDSDAEENGLFVYQRIKAKRPTFDALMEAIKENDVEVRKKDAIQGFNGSASELLGNIE